MAEEPRPASRQQEGLSDKPRILGRQPGSPRVLAPVEESGEPRAEVAHQNRAEVGPQPGPAAKDVPQNNSNANGTSTSSADSLIESLQASRAALEGLLAKTHEIHEESWRTMQTLFEDLHQKLSQEHKARVQGFEKEVNDRGRYQTAALLDKIDLEAESRLTARLDRALDKAQEAERQSVRLLEEKVAANRASLTEFTNTATQELQRQKTSCLADLQTEAQKRFGILKIEHSNYFENVAKRTADSLSEQFAKRAAVAAEAFEKRVQKLSADITDQWEKKLAALSDEAIARISKEAMVIVSRETSNHLIKTLHKRLDELANSLND